MSRGRGHVQQAILSLIHSDADGAWLLGKICERVYPGINRVEKKHRVAVARALRTMTLPQGWITWPIYGSAAEYCLYNMCSLRSAVTHHLSGCEWWDRVPPSDEYIAKYYGPDTSTYKQVQDAIRWRDAGEAERLKIRFDECTQIAAQAARAGITKYAHEAIAESRQLKKRMDELSGRQSSGTAQAIRGCIAACPKASAGKAK
jgi:hypothetical protein